MGGGVAVRVLQRGAPEPSRESVTPGRTFFLTGNEMEGAAESMTESLSSGVGRL